MLSMSVILVALNSETYVFLSLQWFCVSDYLYYEDYIQSLRIFKNERNDVIIKGILIKSFS